MNKNKWKQIAREENEKMNEVFRSYPQDPHIWVIVKKAVLEFVSEVDKATEVYEMENKR